MYHSLLLTFSNRSRRSTTLYIILFARSCLLIWYEVPKWWLRCLCSLSSWRISKCPDREVQSIHDLSRLAIFYVWQHPWKYWTALGAFYCCSWKMRTQLKMVSIVFPRQNHQFLSEVFLYSGKIVARKGKRARVVPSTSVYWRRGVVQCDYYYQFGRTFIEGASRFIFGQCIHETDVRLAFFFTL